MPSSTSGIFFSRYMSEFSARLRADFNIKIAARHLEDGEMERWVLATLFANSSEPREVYINVLFVTKMERVDDHTEVEFSSGTKISVMELPHRLIGHKPDRPI
jgi:hypothetical protein